MCIRDRAYIDSTITAYKSKGIKADLAPIYATQSYLYEKMGDYKNALKAVRTTNNIRFNERVEEAQDVYKRQGFFVSVKSRPYHAAPE